MSKVTIRLLRCGVLSLLLGALLATGLWAGKPIDLGEPFPAVPLPAPTDPVRRDYLGLAEQGPFTLDQIKGRIVLVEMLNVLCPHCRQQTKPYNELYRMIEADPETRGRIKMLGVAVANDDAAIEDFVDIYAVAFPVVSDRHFALHRALRAGPTPFSLYVLRDRPGETGVVAGTRLGVDRDMDELFAYLKELLAMNSAAFAGLPRDRQADQELLRPPQPEAEVAQLVASALAEQGEGLSDFRRLELASGRWVYAARLSRDGRRQPVFAEVANRSAICDICHSVHFFYIFDRTGLILDFRPLHLTKHGNVEWDRADLKQFRRRVVGKRLAGAWDFDPGIDAVTSATMTSAIIFDDLGRGRELLEELQRGALLNP